MAAAAPPKMRPSSPCSAASARAPPARSACGPRRRTARRSPASTRNARRPSRRAPATPRAPLPAPPPRRPVSPSRRTPRSNRQHFISVGPSCAATTRGQKSIRAAGSAPYSATWIWRERSQPTSVQSPLPPDRRRGSRPRGRAAAQVHRAARGRQLAQVDRLEPQVDRRQVLVVVDDRARHLHQLRRLGRVDLEHAHPHRCGLDDEVHVLEPPLHDGHVPARRGPSASRCRCRPTGRRRTRPRPAPPARSGRDRREDVLAHEVLDLHDRVPLAAPGDHELGAPVHPPPDQPLPQRRLVEPGASCATPRAAAR